MTHFASAESDPAYTRFQFDHFLSFFCISSRKAILPGRDIVVIVLLFFLFQKCISIYPGWGLPCGAFLPGERSCPAIRFKAGDEVKARVKQVKTLPPGFSVGYGRTFTTTRETRLAAISIGYSQGLFRSLSNRMEVLIRGRRAPSREIFPWTR